MFETDGHRRGRVEERLVRERPVLPSILSSRLKLWLSLAIGLAVFMVANTLYLLANRAADGLGLGFFAVGETSLPVLFQAMVLTHTGVGLLLVALMIGFLIAHLPTVWKRRHRASVLSGIGLGVAGAVLAVSGLFILTAAASRNNAWAWWAHVAAAVVIVGAYAGHRLVSYARPPRQRARRFAALTAGLFALVVGLHMLTKRDVQLTPEAQIAREQGLPTGPGARERDVADFVDGDFVPVALVPPQSPFFPSAATTSTGGYLPARIITREGGGDLAERVAAEVAERGFVSDIRIGAAACERCHPDVTEQWSTSAHRFASINNPFYEATIEDLRAGSLESNEAVDIHLAEFGLPTDAVGRVKSKWCSGCHDPALMLAGDMDDPIDRTTVEAQAGLTCLACHAIDSVHDQTGNGNYNIADEQEDPYLFAGAGEGTLRELLHDAALKAKPTVHIRQMLSPDLQTPEFCGSCHKVSLTEPVNNYRWLRGQNEYDAWHDSGVSLNASRTFYLPPTKRICHDCHMPLEEAPLGDLAADGGKVRSHRFLAVNTGLPFVRGDTATIRRIEEFLRDAKMRVDVFALRRAGSDVPVMPLDARRPVLQAGETVTFDVVVRNLGVGHTFPGGTNDSNEGWLEFTVLDQDGHEIARSGAVREDGHLDPLAHMYKAVILDRNGDPIQRRNAQDIHVFAAANVVGPGTADVAHYRVRVPEGVSSLTLRVRLLWRKFDRAYTEFAYGANPAGFRAFADVPDLPVTEIASNEVTLAVGDPVAVPPTSESVQMHAVPMWVRFNDYGIALRREGNTRAALIPFEAVERREPDRVDGPLNQARLALDEGSIEAAYEHLERVEATGARDARVDWVWGGVLQADGRYIESAQAYRSVLSAFPGDRQAWFQLGLSLYLGSRWDEAIAAFDRVLEIDPEHRQAHYNRMLSLRALGRDDEAARAEQAFERYRIDEAASAIALGFRAENPGVNLMATPIHTHDLTAPEAPRQ
ncbi:MAG: tetratricopeptide repeat protein [Gemmatimonadota bacterium]|nr:tetratricopeptide repeat protein [Gemmatimonadota bacterium]